MRIGKIASGAEYRINKQFQNFTIFDIPDWRNSINLLIFQTVKFCKFVNFLIWRIQKISQML